MIYRKQEDYDTFRCIAGKCPKSCCIGWQIMIDEQSLDKYKAVTGPFSERISSAVDYPAECFRQHGTRCNMLNECGLCDLQSAMGEDYLCDTCRLYPRHIEEFQDLREYSLSLSCPEVVRMILDADYDFTWTESEDTLLDDPEEFEEFDFFIFDQLEFARDKMFTVASDHSLSLQERMSRIAATAYQLQELYDEGEILAMGEITCTFSENYAGTGISLDYDYCMKSLDVLTDMEVLENSWTDSIIATKKYWEQHPADSGEWTAAMFPVSNLEHVFENIFKSLLFTYFCGAVYDGQIYARAMIAVQSIRFLMLIHAATGDNLASTIYLYSREVEHSDENVNTLISYFEGELD
jgi:lysine-N-methylase